MDAEIIEKIYRPLFLLKQKLLAAFIEHPVAKRQMTPEELAALRMPLLKQHLIKFRDSTQHQLKPLQLTIQSLNQRAIAEGEAILQCANQNLQLILRTLWSDSIDALGIPPCDYALIAFGSLADGLATLHSDLEFGILIADSTQKNYFRKVTQLMQFNTILLGETTLNILRPPECDKAEYAELFKQCRIKNGVSFDGAGEGGGKSPLGNPAGVNLVTDVVSLVNCAMSRYAAPYQTLSSDLLNTVFIAGNKSLWENYQTQLQQRLQNSAVKADYQHHLARQLVADLEHFDPVMGRSLADGKREFSPKHNLLRLPALALRLLWLREGHFPIGNDITLTEKLSLLNKRSIITDSSTQQLRRLLSEVALIRLSYYLEKQEQREDIIMQDHSVLTEAHVTQLYRQLLPFYEATLRYLLSEAKQIDMAFALPETWVAEVIERELKPAGAQVAPAFTPLPLPATSQSPVHTGDSLLLAYRLVKESQFLAPERIHASIQFAKQALADYREQGLSDKSSPRIASVQLQLAVLYGRLRYYKEALEALNVARQICFQRQGLFITTADCNHVAALLETWQTDISLPLQTGYEQQQRNSAGNAMSWVQVKEYYIEPLLTVKDNIADTEKNFTGTVVEFIQTQLIDPTRTQQHDVHLLFGEGGMGKSTLLQALADSLWERYRQQPDRQPIPVLISLNSIPQRSETADFLTRFFELCGYEKPQIAQLRQKQFIFLLDGYDELVFRDGERNILNEGQFFLWKGITLISCRTQLVANCQGFKPAKSYYLTGFNDEKKRLYLSKRAKQTPPLQSLLSAINLEQTHLWSLITNPLILYMVCDSLPALSTLLAANKQITRFDVYQSFTHKWFVREYERLVTEGALASVKLMGSVSKRWQEALISYAIQLAMLMLDTRNVSINETLLHETETQFLQTVLKVNNPDNHVLQLRNACPLKVVEKNDYQFIHKSFQEFLIAKKIADLYLDEKVSAETAIHHIQDDNPFSAIWPMPDNPWQLLWQREPAVMSFLAECIQQNEQHKTRLFELVSYSRKDIDNPHRSKAVIIKSLSELQRQTEKQKQNRIKAVAANAMTILHYAGINFSGKNLSAIRIKGADLSQGLFHQTNFQRANLKQVHYQQSFLREANLQHAKLADIQFGERASFRCPSEIECLAYSPDGRWLAAGCRDNNIYLLDAQSGQVQQTLQGHTSRVTCLAFQGEVLASGSHDNTIRLWDAASGATRRVLQGHTSIVTCLAFQGEVLASGSHDTTIRLWDATSGATRRVLQGHTSPVTCLAWQGEVLASGSDNKTIRLWDAVSGAPRRVLQGHTERVTCLALKGEVLASGSEDKTIRLWDAASGATRRVLQGHTERVTCLALQGEVLASGSWDSTIRLWDAASGATRRVLQGHTSTVTCLALQGEGLASGSDDSTIRLWDAASGATRCVLQGHTNGVTCLALQGEVLASGSWDSTIRLWDAASGATRRVLKGHTDWVTCLALQGEVLASGSQDNTIRLWDAASGATRCVLEGHTDWVTCLALQGEVLASGSQDNTIRLWDTPSGATRCVLQGHTDRVTCLAWQGEVLASGSQDNTIRLWDTPSGATRRVLQGHTDWVRCMAFQGEVLASGSGDKTIRLWDSGTGDCRHVLRGHQNKIVALSFLLKGAYLLSWAVDGDVLLWCTATGQLIERRRIAPSFSAIAYQPERLTTGDGQGSVKLWRVVGPDTLAQNPPRLPNWQLQWTSGHQPLNVTGMTVMGAHGLSDENQRLLQQRGATGME